MNTSNQYSAFYAWIKELHNAFIPFLEKSMLLPHLEDFLASFIVLLLAYTAFTLVGFGSALIAGAPLAHYLPVSRVIPLLALLDFIGASLRAWQSRQLIDPPSLRKLLPGMLIGQMIGVYGLIYKFLLKNTLHFPQIPNREGNFHGQLMDIAGGVGSMIAPAAGAFVSPVLSSPELFWIKG